jgi:hypothetical protein
MAVLTAGERQKLPKKSFALPGKGEGPKGAGSGSYPIPDASHARNALARVSQHGSSAEKAAVRAKVHSKFPEIGKKKDNPGKGRTMSDRMKRMMGEGRVSGDTMRKRGMNVDEE